MAERSHTTLEDLLAADPRDPGCDGSFELLDEYVDLEARGEDAAARLPAVAVHLGGCSSCRFDYESLLRYAKSSRAELS